MSVWDDIVGQPTAVEQLEGAARAAARVLSGSTGELLEADAPGTMTHAWLLTGPPGSGRSTAARAFVAALLCRDAGCGTCADCRTARSGTHADIDVLNTQHLSIGVDSARELVTRAARRPAGGRWRVFLIEDADRLTEQAANALLKAIEEPAPRTVWALCAPGLQDVLPTIRSRCRHVQLRTPSAEAVAEVLVRRDGIDPAMAAFAARASQGHIGRARRLASDEAARLRRRAVLRVPTELGRLADCLLAAAELVDAATEDAASATAELDAREAEELGRALGVGTQGRGAQTGAAAQLKALESEQKRRVVRQRRDALDRALVDLSSFYRDVLVVQLGAAVELVNEEIRDSVTKVATRSTPEETVRRVDAVLACRQAIDASVAPLLAVEALAITLRRP